MAKHTPGPWVAECDNEDREDGADEITARGIVIARVCGEDEIRARMNRGKIERPGSTAAADSLDEVEANARLMALAPELYVLLDQVEELWAFNDDHIDERSDFDKAWLERVRAIVAKIEG